ncbi:MAG: sigma factor-like helix-turn-helix DNA-binding protein [Clostridium sp.]|nr:sigma factor-like helix-turn-helix DNA-binding protein [Clostridium sp.]
MRRKDMIDKTIKRLDEAAEIRKGNITFQKGNDLIKNIHIEDREYKFKELLNAISKLNQQDQELIGYRYLDGMSYRNIGNLLHISSSSVPRYIDNAVLRLGRALYGLEKEFFNEFK